MFYTLGQRQGLSIGGLKGFPEKPWYVSRKNIADNILVITQDEQDLLQSRLHCVQVHWISGNPPAYPLHCTAKIRYRQLDEPCIVTLTNETTLQVDFERPQRAVTPGQSIVFYDHAICLGGGIISNDWPL
jgi:tRNA-specific 2-thiouridylase